MPTLSDTFVLTEPVAGCQLGNFHLAVCICFSFSDEDSWSTCKKLSTTKCLSPVLTPKTPVAASREPSKLKDCNPPTVTVKPKTCSGEPQTQPSMPQTLVTASVESSEDCGLSLETVRTKTPSGPQIPQIIVASPIETLSHKISVTRRMSVACSLSPPPQSPFHVSTPDSPYGQVFKTPTDSSKKRWKKWIESFPNYRYMCSPCSTQQRKNSTVIISH